MLPVSVKETAALGIRSQAGCLKSRPILLAPKGTLSEQLNTEPRQDKESNTAVTPYEGPLVTHPTGLIISQLLIFGENRTEGPRWVYLTHWEGKSNRKRQDCTSVSAFLSAKGPPFRLLTSSGLPFLEGVGAIARFSRTLQGS